AARAPRSRSACAGGGAACAARRANINARARRGLAPPIASPTKPAQLSAEHLLEKLPLEPISCSLASGSPSCAPRSALPSSSRASHEGLMRIWIILVLSQANARLRRRRNLKQSQRPRRQGRSHNADDRTLDNEPRIARQPVPFGDGSPHMRQRQKAEQSR